MGFLRTVHNCPKPDPTTTIRDGRAVGSLWQCDAENCGRVWRLTHTIEGIGWSEEPKGQALSGRTTIRQYAADHPRGIFVWGAGVALLGLILIFFTASRF